MSQQQHGNDPALEALELLRGDDHLELAPPFRAPRRPRSVRRRWLPTVVVALGLGAAAAAAGGAEALRAWWFSISVDGEQVEEGSKHHIYPRRCYTIDFICKKE